MQSVSKEGTSFKDGFSCLRVNSFVLWWNWLDEGTDFSDKDPSFKASFQSRRGLYCQWWPLSWPTYIHLLWRNISPIDNQTTAMVHLIVAHKILRAIHQWKVTPRLVNTDQAGQLQSVWVSGYRKRGQVTTRIIRHNAVLPFCSGMTTTHLWVWQQQQSKL